MNQNDERWGKECHICGKTFSAEQWDERHTLHADNCAGEGCDCDYPVHATHCPACGETNDRAFFIMYKREHPEGVNP